MKKAVVMFLLLSLLVMSNAVYAVDILPGGLPAFPGAEGGTNDGTAVGDTVGDEPGSSVGELVGSAVGGAIGSLVGPAVALGSGTGVLVGLEVGDDVGSAVGAFVGSAVGGDVGTGSALNTTSKPIFSLGITNVLLYTTELPFDVRIVICAFCPAIPGTASTKTTDFSPILYLFELSAE